MDGIRTICERCNQPSMTIEDHLIDRDICDACTQVLYAQLPYLSETMLKDLKEYGTERD